MSTGPQKQISSRGYHQPNRILNMCNYTIRNVKYVITCRWPQTALNSSGNDVYMKKFLIRSYGYYDIHIFDIEHNENKHENTV